MADSIAMARPEARERSALIRRAGSGDADAFERLIRPTLQRQLRLAIALTRNEMDARDIVQDACLKAWRKLPRLRDPDRFESWLNQIVVNTARSHLRARRRASVRELRIDEVEAAVPSTHGGPAAFDERDAIRRAFRRLDPDKRLILALHYVEGQAVADIARALRIPEGTAKWRLHSARAALERTLEGEGA